LAVVVSFASAGVRGFLHRPQTPGDLGLVLTHGAGSDCSAPLLVAVATAFCDAGVMVLRCDLPFRQRRPKGPPSPSLAAADRAGLQSAIVALREFIRGDIELGGHSYGGRQGSMLAADEPETAAGLLLLSYPLHPPDKPAQLRTAHFPRLRVPVTLVQGTSDPFGSIGELEKALPIIPAPTHLIAIDGAGHDLKRGRIDLGPIVAAVMKAATSRTRCR
jgi:uncharacterized protein